MPSTIDWLREQWFIEFCILQYANAVNNDSLVKKVIKTLETLDKKLKEDNGKDIPRLVTSIMKDGEVVDTITTTFQNATHFKSTSTKGSYIREMKFGLYLTRKIEQHALASYGVKLRINQSIIRDHD